MNNSRRSLFGKVLGAAACAAGVLWNHPRQARAVAVRAEDFAPLGPLIEGEACKFTPAAAFELTPEDVALVKQLRALLAGGELGVTDTSHCVELCRDGTSIVARGPVVLAILPPGE